MNKYCKMIENLDEMFDIFNEKLFANELEKPVISIQADYTNKAYGWCSVNKVWETCDEEAYYEINICAEHMRRSFHEIAGTLLHEMVHLYNLMNDIKDCNASQYHNKNYKVAAEAHGLNVEKTSHGYSHATLNDVSRAIADTMTYSFDIARKPRVKTSSSKNKPTLKYMCPCCGAKVYSTSELNITCNDCGEDFIQY